MQYGEEDDTTGVLCGHYSDGREGSSSASSIRGVVDEPTGELIPGAQVTVIDQSNPDFTLKKQDELAWRIPIL